MFSWTKKGKRSFHAENLKRQQKPYIALGRGWYHIYTFRLGRAEEVSLDWLPDYPGETLALVRLDIRDYASRELDTLALDFSGAEKRDDPARLLRYGGKGDGARAAAHFCGAETHAGAR